MSKFTSKIFKEVVKDTNDDSFFQPKDLEKRIEKKRNEHLRKIQLGLQNIKIAYENKEYESKEEKIFLKIFCKLHLDEVYDEKYDGYFLLNENNDQICFFYLRIKFFVSSYEYIWKIFEDKFNWQPNKPLQFIQIMLSKYFNLNGITPTYSYFI